MSLGRLVRVAQRRGDPDAAIYIVAIDDGTQAVALIRSQVASAHDVVEDLGPVSDFLLEAVKLGSGQYRRC